MKLYPSWYIPPHLRKAEKRSGASIIKAVVAEFGIDRETLTGTGRSRKIARARHVAWYAMSRNCPHISYPQMAKMLGRTDHSTAIHGVRLVENLVARDMEFAGIVERVERSARDY